MLQRFAIRLLLLCAVCAALFAQTVVVLRGTVSDETGGVIPGAKVTLSGPSGAIQTVTAGGDGTYSFTNIAPGNYSVVATFPGLTQFQPSKIILNSGVQTLNLQLRVTAEKQEVTVQDTAGPTISTDPSNNAGALVLRGEDLQALSDDPDDLQSDLQALAGPAAGPNGGQIYIDGFSGGQLPNKDSIREVRINQNPFSPEYDQLGYGRIEIFTKPGTDNLRGQAYFNYGNGIWNSRNPYAAEKAPFDLKEYGGNLSGPITKKASFFLDVDRRDIDNSAIIDAQILNQSTLGITPYTGVYQTPYRRLRISPRIDYQITPKNTLMVRYGYTDNGAYNSGVGGFNLQSLAYNNNTLDHTVQITDTIVINPNVINETRFQFYHTVNTETASNNAATINVLQSFTEGGAQVARTYNLDNSFEGQNYTSINKGRHSIKFGVRMRGSTLDSYSPQNFGGTFTFGAATNAPVLDADGNPIGDETEQLTSIERYQRTYQLLNLGFTGTQIQALGGGPTNYTVSGGNPYVAAGQADAGIFFGDDWRVKPNLTLSLGLRYEVQTNIHDYRDIAPRIGFAWAPGGKSTSMMARPKIVIRGGTGVFYNRFDVSNVLTAERDNGINQVQYIVSNPTFFPYAPTAGNISQYVSTATSSITEYDRNLRAPYLIQSGIGVERQLGRNTTLAVNYLNSHGVHLFRSNEINAPLPGTFDTADPVYPYGTAQPIYLMKSDGLYNQNQLITNVNSRLNKNVSLFGFYMYGHANSNADGFGTYPANPYSDVGEYGPSANDVHHRAFVGGSIATKWDIRLSPFIIAQTGAPFNITTGEDIYDSALFTARPGILPAGTSTVGTDYIATKYGILDPNPTIGQPTLPRDYGRGPGQFFINLRLAKTFGFGPERGGGNGASGMPGMMGPGGPRGGGGRGGPGGGPGGMFGGGSTNHRYNLTLSAQVRNILNHTNPGPIIGNITSPLFGQANSIAGGFGAFAENANNRRMELQLRFTF